MSSEPGAGIRVPAPVSAADFRQHLDWVHGVYLESWVTAASLVEAHELAHGADAGRRWCTHIPHWHTPAPPPPPPEPERTWW